MGVSSETIEALKSKHGEVFEISACGYDFVVRVPTSVECERWQDKAAEDKKKGIRALGQLVRDVLVFPSLDEYDAILSKRPMLSTSLGGEVLKIAGATDDVEVKKA